MFNCSSELWNSLLVKQKNQANMACMLNEQKHHEVLHKILFFHLTDHGCGKNKSLIDFRTGSGKNI